MLPEFTMPEVAILETHACVRVTPRVRGVSIGASHAHGLSRRRARGFTLFEVGVVISLLVLLAGLMWPALDARIRAAELPESADNVRSMLRMARASAALTGQRYRIRWQKDVQQPHIEYQVDAVRDPTRWEACADGWASEPILLGDVQVHSISLGRPEYMIPISHTQGSVTEDLSDSITESDDASSSATEAAEVGFVETSESEEDVDEDRPTIVFEIDGSVDWHTLVIARILPGEELKDEDRQMWIVLDGRTGLPLLQEQLTEEQMGEITRRPDLDKLQPPKLNKDDLEITATLPGEGDAGAGDGAKSGVPGEEQAGSLGDGQATLGRTGDTGQGRQTRDSQNNGDRGSNDNDAGNGENMPTKPEGDGMNDDNSNGEKSPMDQNGGGGQRRGGRRGTGQRGGM